MIFIHDKQHRCLFASMTQGLDWSKENVLYMTCFQNLTNKHNSHYIYLHFLQSPDFIHPLINIRKGGWRIVRGIELNPLG